MVLLFQRAVVALLVVLAGCSLIDAAGGTPTPPAGPAASLTLVEGDGQSGGIGTSLAPFVVKVADAEARPVGDVAVEFVVTIGSGTVSAPIAITDQDGLARTTLMLGNTVGANQVEARVVGVPAVVFTAGTLSGTPARIAHVSGTGQTAASGSTLGLPFVVVVEDAGANPVAGFAVMFVVTQGGGNLTAATVVSDAQGRASSKLTLGTVAGINRVEARGTGLVGSPVVFTATGLVGPATQIVAVSGDGQTGTAGAAVAPFVVSVHDANSNPIAGVNVSFVVTAGGGGVAPASAVTNASGQAQTTLTLGTSAGLNRIEARVTGLTARVFTATGTAGAPASIAMTSGDGQMGATGTALGAPFVVTVRDANANHVAGVDVDFVVTAGGGNVLPAVATTDTQGLAQSTLTLGAAPGTNRVEARVSGLVGSPIEFTAVAPSGPAAQIALISGDGQSATAGSQVAQPLVVTVRDAANNPVPGFTVGFVVTGGGGSVGTPSVLTNAQGQAQTTWTLGTIVGANTLEARATGLAGSPIEFTATGVVGPANKIVLVSGGGQSGTVGTALPSPFVVAVQDVNSNAITGHTVSFVKTLGNGSVAPASALTNAQGRAETTLTLGATAGTNRVEARATGLIGSPIIFNATGNAGPATQIALTSGNNQNGIVGTALAAPFVVTTRDANSNAVAGVSVSFVVTAGGGSMSATSVTTNASGQASSTLTLGPMVATNTVEARATGLTGSPVVFTAIGNGGPPATIELTSGNGQSGTAGALLAQPFVVTVRDAMTNPVLGVTVSFVKTIGNGSVNPTSQATNTSGQAQTTLRLGTTAGNNAVEARVTGLAGSPVVFTATGDPGPAFKIVLTSGNGQSGVTSQPLGAPFVVTVQDANNNGVAGTTVDWVITASNGSLSAASTVTNAAGQAQTTMTLGSTTTTNRAEARSGTLQGTPILFSALAFEPNDFATGGEPEAMVAADFNGDGKPDLATQNGAFSVLETSVLLNTTPGGDTLASFTRFNFAGSFSGETIASLDINQDGKPDLVTTSFGGTAAIHLNTTPVGAATATFTGHSISVTSFIEDVAAGDLNADGAPDLVIADESNIAVLFNTTPPGATTPSFAPFVHFPASLVDAVAIGDINGDGNPDVIAGIQSNMRVFINTTPAGAPAPTFATPVNFAATNPTSIAIVDINRDGKLDVALAAGTGASVFLNTTVIGSQTPTFATRVDFATGAVACSIASGDLDQDGVADLAVVNQGDDTVSILRNTTLISSSTPTFAPKQDTATANEPTAVVITDLNTDGKLDFAVTSRATNSVRVRLTP